MFLALQLPDSASAQRSDAAEQKITAALLKTPGVEGVIAVNDFSLLAQVQSTNSGFFFVNLKPWAVRKSKEEQLAYIQSHLQRQPPPIRTASPSRFHRPPFPASVLRVVSP